MGRTHKILTGKSYTDQRTFLAHPDSLFYTGGSEFGLGNLSNRIYFGATRDEERLILKDAAARKAASGRGWGGIHFNPAVAAHFARRGYSTNFSQAIADFSQRSYWGDTSMEQKLISFQMLNEFLAQDTYEVYGDFLAEHWDELYEKAVNFVFNEYSWSIALMQELRVTNLITFRPQLPQIAQKLIENLTKEQIIKLRLQPSINDSISNKDARARLENALVVLSGGQQISVPPIYIMNSFVRALTRTMSNTTATSSVKLTFILTQFLEAAGPWHSYLTEDKAKSSADVLFTNDIGRYSDFLVENADKFTLPEMFFACVAWNETKLISRTGSRDDVLKLFLSVMDHYKDDPDNVLEFFKMVGEAGATYDGELPTMTHWKKAITNGYLDGIMGAELTLTLIAGSDKQVEKLERQKLYRRSLKGEI